MIQKCSSLFFNLRKQLHAVFPFYLKFARKGGFLCSSEHGKLCFKCLITVLSASKQLALPGAKKSLRSRDFIINQWIYDGSER
jgi:hypothetical protein